MPCVKTGIRYEIPSGSSQDGRDKGLLFLNEGIALERLSLIHLRGEKSKAGTDALLFFFLFV